MAKTLNTSEIARQRVADSRARFHETLAVARRELTPATVSQRATRRFRNRAQNVAQQHPALSAAIITAFFAYLFRKPLAGLIRRFSREKRHG